MSRGITLFNELIAETTTPEKLQKGRSKSHIDRRNELLLDRLYHFKKIFGFDYDYVLEILSAELFLSDVTIPCIIQKSDSQLYLRNLKLSQPNRPELETKWPHLVWNEKELLKIYGVKMLRTA